VITQCVLHLPNRPDYGVVVWVGSLVISMINPLNREAVMEICFTFMVEMERCGRTWFP